jgi:hypothetical protein
MGNAKQLIEAVANGQDPIDVVLSEANTKPDDVAKEAENIIKAMGSQWEVVVKKNDEMNTFVDGQLQAVPAVTVSAKLFGKLNWLPLHGGKKDWYTASCGFAVTKGDNPRGFAYAEWPDYWGKPAGVGGRKRRGFTAGMSVVEVDEGSGTKPQTALKKLTKIANFLKSKKKNWDDDKGR